MGRRKNWRMVSVAHAGVSRWPKNLNNDDIESLEPGSKSNSGGSTPAGPVDRGDGFFSDGGYGSDGDMSGWEDEGLEDNDDDKLEGDELIESLRRGVEHELIILGEPCMQSTC